MKIGILTFHRAINYGAFLQAFALKSFLEKIGYDVCMVDYWPKPHEASYQLLNPRWKQLALVGKLKCLLAFGISYKRANKRKCKMESLLQKNLGVEKMIKYRTPESLSDLNLDCIVYGSDQIWWKSVIPGYEGFDPVYWGGYINQSVRKIAYAPSMGVINLTNDDKKVIKKYLQNFAAVSVREISLFDEIFSLSSQDISVVLDPIFLLNKKEWTDLCKPLVRKNYILYYNLISSKDADAFVEILQKKHGLEVLEVTGRIYPLKNGSRYYQTLDAFEFISYIENADLVVTNSFHGTAFSILFEKQFFTLGMGNNSGRVSSLLSMLDIEERLLQTIECFPVEEINYKEVKPKLNIKIEQAKVYLENALS